MATVIHHGAPGSYKSFTLVQRFLIPFLKEGKIIVTNIRGLDNPANIIATFPDFEFPSTARLIFVDCTTQAGRDKMARWFHWVPIGSQIFIDELQEIYPARADFKMIDLDTYTPLAGDEPIESVAIGEGRPRDIFVAFDKQRHYNWNIYGSTTNIAKVKKEIRQVCEWAYRHRDTSGMLPWKKNTWIEHQHDPETSGKSASHRVGLPVEYKADPRIFNCYSSTATGSHEASKAGRSILSDPKIRAVLFVLCCSISYLVYFALQYFSKPVPSSQPAVSSVTTSVKQVPKLPETSSVQVHDAVDNRADILVPNKDLAVNVPKVLTRDLVLKWTIKMVDADLFDVPPSVCRISYPHVVCRSTDDFINVARNYTCEDKSDTVKVCTLLFNVSPESIQQPLNQVSLLGK